MQYAGQLHRSGWFGTRSWQFQALLIILPARNEVQRPSRFFLAGTEILGPLGVILSVPPGALLDPGAERNDELASSNLKTPGCTIGSLRGSPQVPPKSSSRIGFAVGSI